MSNEKNGYQRYISLGTNIAAGMGLFIFIGYQIDQKRGAGQLWTIIGALMGLLYCGYEIWKIIKS